MLFLILAAMFWGTTFVAQDLASDTVGPFTFNGLRMIIGGGILLLAVWIKNKGKLFSSVEEGKGKKYLLFAGMICGALIFFAANFQQAGIEFGTTAGKSGFITAMYVVFVPLFGLCIKKKVRGEIWICVFLAAAGLYLLCMADFSAGLSGFLANLKMTTGDVLTLVCAVCFAVHIIAVDYFAPHTDGVFLSAVQFLSAGLIGVVFMLFLESPTWEGILAASGGILYSAIFSCCIAYTLQILGQRETPAAIAAILMCLESVFAVISDALVLGTKMSLEEVTGCVLMFIALIASSLSGTMRPEEKRR